MPELTGRTSAAWNGMKKIRQLICWTAWPKLWRYRFQSCLSSRAPVTRHLCRCSGEGSARDSQTDRHGRGGNRTFLM